MINLTPLAEFHDFLCRGTDIELLYENKRYMIYTWHESKEDLFAITFTYFPKDSEKEEFIDLFDKKVKTEEMYKVIEIFMQTPFFENAKSLYDVYYNLDILNIF